MRVIIIGAGEVGFHLAQQLSAEGNDVVVVELDPERAEAVAERLDVLTVTGNGASLAVLERAGIQRADLLLAVASKDEANLLSCLAAARLGVRFKVARISNPEFETSGTVFSRDQLGIDLLINPERECAWEAFQLLNSAAATDLARFADGRIQIVGLRVKSDAPVAGKTLAQLDRELKGRRYITVAIVREGITEIPTGTSRIEAGDQIFMLAPSTEMPAIPPLAGYEPFKLKRVMIAGGSNEGLYLAQLLEDQGVECTIIDVNRRRCLELSELLQRTLVLHGDATDLDLLEMEGVEGIDGFVALTGHDETNVLSSLVAKSFGARKVISRIEKLGYLPLVTKVGVDAAVSPRMSTVNAILRYVRRGNVLAVATMKGIGAEAIELDVGPRTRIIGKELHSVRFPEGALLGAIIRGDEVITPRGHDAVQVGDRVVVFMLPEAVADIEALFA